MLTKQENIPSCLLCGKNNQADSNSCKKYKNLCLPCIFEKILNKALIENYHIKDCEGCRIYFENNSKQCNTCKVYKKTNDMLLTPRCKTHYYCENCINKRRIETLTYQKCQNCAGFFNSIEKIRDSSNCNLCGHFSEKETCQNNHSYCTTCKEFLVRNNCEKFINVARCEFCVNFFYQNNGKPSDSSQLMENAYYRGNGEPNDTEIRDYNKHIPENYYSGYNYEKNDIDTGYNHSNTEIRGYDQHIPENYYSGYNYEKNDIDTGYNHSNSEVINGEYDYTNNTNNYSTKSYYQVAEVNNFANYSQNIIENQTNPVYNPQQGPHELISYNSLNYSQDLCSECNSPSEFKFDCGHLYCVDCAIAKCIFDLVYFRSFMFSWDFTNLRQRFSFQCKCLNG